jgi:thioredoxin reductase (NADPH)
LGIKGEDELIGRGVSYCATCDGRFFAGKTVAVVGGGNTALGDVLHLSRIAEKVILIHRRDTFRATKVYRDAVEKLENVKIMFDSEVTELFYDNKLKGISVKNRKTGITEKINCDGLFVGIGRNPATELLKGVISTDEKGYISADETTETNIPGVYAVGDVRTKPLRQVATAVSDGAVAIAKAEEYIENI